MSLQGKIVWPFLLLFAAAFVLIAVFASQVVSGVVERSLRERLTSVARVLSHGGFSASEELLQKMQPIVGAEMARYGPRSGRLISTLDRQGSQELQEFLRARPESAPVPASLLLGGKEYRYVSAEVPGGAPEEAAYLYLLLPEAAWREAKLRALKPVLLTSLLGLLAVAVVGWMLARRIASPVRELARLASEFGMRSAECGIKDPPFRVPHSEFGMGNDEIGELYRAFQGMVEKLARSREELIRRERLAAAGKLAASLAHEIRNPLASLRLTAGLLEGSLQTSKDREALRVLSGELTRLELLTQSLLTLARPSPPELALVGLTELCEEMLSLLARQFSHSHIEVRREYGDNLPRPRLDRNQIKQVLLNLMLNALAAMPRGGRLTLRVGGDPGGQEVHLEVADTGSGIPEPVLEHIFEPFCTTREGGSGLGLALSRRIVEEHGGKLTFTSSPGGATFRASLPV